MMSMPVITTMNGDLPANTTLNLNTILNRNIKIEPLLLHRWIVMILLGLHDLLLGC
jgi:hypothetical protein